MDSSFFYDRPALGRDSAERSPRTDVLCNLLAGHENIALFAPPRSGKSSFILQAFSEMKPGGGSMLTASFNAFPARSSMEFLTRLGECVLKAVTSSPEAYQEMVRTHLQGTHFIFDERQFESSGRILSTNWDLDEADMRAVLSLPALLSSRSGVPAMTVWIKEFQQILAYPDADALQRSFRRVLEDTRSAPCSYLLTGSQVNAMKSIFCSSHLFSPVVMVLELPRAAENRIVEHIRSRFSLSGKVAERDLLRGPVMLLDGNMWYINQLMSICNGISRGFINSSVMGDALNRLLAIHEPKFRMVMEGLTLFQIGFLEAMVDGELRLSSAQSIRRYGLNSSANVLRVREALMKKEVITLDEKGDPMCQDPLFRYWLEKIYFAR